MPFSTLNSGLRDETAMITGLPENWTTTFSTLNSGLRDETLTRKRGRTNQKTFSTLNSGLRDETPPGDAVVGGLCFFQYPQLGPTR